MYTRTCLCYVSVSQVEIIQDILTARQLEATRERAEDAKEAPHVINSDGSMSTININLDDRIGTLRYIHHHILALTYT